MEKETKKNPNKRFFHFFLRVMKLINRNILGISKAIIFELDLENPSKRRATDLNLSFRLATKKDIEKMDKEHYDYDKKAKKYSLNRLEKGDRCILALYNNKIIGYMWTMKDAMELTQAKYISLSKDRAHLYKGYVLNEFRGRRVHQAMYNYSVEMLKKEGKRFIISVVDTDNTSSLKTKTGSEFKIVGYLVHVRFFGFKYDYIKKNELHYLQNQ